MNYTIGSQSISRGYDRKTCWTQARAGIIPSAIGHQTAVLTMQKLRLAGSDAYEAIHSMYSQDGGRHWSKPVPQQSFGRNFLNYEEGLEQTVCDFTPQWHAASNTLLSTGHTVNFLHGVVTSKYPRGTAYSTYDAKNHRWNAWKELQFPDLPQFFRSGAGCTQRVDLESGEILLPIYLAAEGSQNLSSTVVRCAFDGEILKYIEHGNELSVNAPRGLGEPSLVRFGGKYFLTLRNDKAGYFAVSDDGLHFNEPQIWHFDDGAELGNYNTQQHWATLGGKLYLVYTRRGLGNDHIFRHRAPIVMAQIDTQKMHVLRKSEREIIPNRGARLGNFGVTQISESEVWIVAAEWMQNSGEWARNMLEKLRATHSVQEIEVFEKSPHICEACEQFGSENNVWIARLLEDNTK